MNYYGSNENKRFSTSRIIQGDIYLVDRYLEGTAQTVFFDPPFASQFADDMAGEDAYYSALRSWCEIADKRLATDGQIVVMNYADGMHIISNKLKELGLEPELKISLKVIPRNGKRRFDTLHINLFKQHVNRCESIEWTDCKHKPGVNGVPEAPQPWLIDRIFYHIGQYDIGNVLDMFGGSGNIPNFCKTFGIDCLCVEKDIKRYNNICERLDIKRPAYSCKIASCGAAVVTRGFCQNHATRARKKVFMGLDGEFEPVIGFRSSTIKELLELSVQSMEKANESHSRATNDVGGSIHGRFDHSQEEAETENTLF